MKSPMSSFLLLLVVVAHANAHGIVSRPTHFSLNSLDDQSLRQNEVVNRHTARLLQAVDDFNISGCFTPVANMTYTPEGATISVSGAFELEFQWRPTIDVPSPEPTEAPAPMTAVTDPVTGVPTPTVTDAPSPAPSPEPVPAPEGETLLLALDLDSDLDNAAQSHEHQLLQAVDLPADAREVFRISSNATRDDDDDEDPDEGEDEDDEETDDEDDDVRSFAVFVGAGSDFQVLVALDNRSCVAELTDAPTTALNVSVSFSSPNITLTITDADNANATARCMLPLPDDEDELDIDDAIVWTSSAYTTASGEVCDLFMTGIDVEPPPSPGVDSALGYQVSFATVAACAILALAAL